MKGFLVVCLFVTALAEIHNPQCLQDADGNCTNEADANLMVQKRMKVGDIQGDTDGLEEQDWKHAGISQASTQGPMQPPPASSACKSACSKQFAVCVKHLGYAKCRGEIDTGGRMVKTFGCIKGCADTAAMAALKAPAPPPPPSPFPPPPPPPLPPPPPPAPTGGPMQPPPAVSETTPTPITSQNRGECYKTRGFPDNVKMWTWKQGNEQLCVSAFIPPEAPKPMPVMMRMDCYNKFNSVASAFGRFPVAVFFLSTLRGGWHPPWNDGIVNDTTPQPCSIEEYPDLAYVTAVFKLIEDDPMTFDKDKIYTSGCSQNGMFATYVGFCFSHKVAGIAQGCSGLVVSPTGRQDPQMAAYCKFSDFQKYGRNCKDKRPCKECKYWPIYPCYEPRPLVYCNAIYEKDFMFSTGKPMYDYATAEGFDARLFEFPGGNHGEVRNYQEWYAGCLGMTPTCSDACAKDVAECVSARGGGGWRVYRECTSFRFFPSSCTKGCSPTKDMLFLSEKPTSSYPDKITFGVTSPKAPRSSASKCQHDAGGTPA